MVLDDIKLFPSLVSLLSAGIVRLSWLEGLDHVGRDVPIRCQVNISCLLLAPIFF